jgi:putative transposase
MEKFNGKFRIPSARWAAWDYGRNGAYFVTICTANHAHYFGKITNAEMILTLLGQAAVDFWNEIPAHFPFVELDAFVVMPNHVHGIIIIDKPGGIVETQDLASLPTGNRFGPQSRNLASIVRGYKIGITKYARQNNAPFIWQERYYDHIIRSPEEHESVWQYILANPLNWAEDKFYC